MAQVDALLQDLTHPRAATRVRAARELSRQPDPAALEPLIAALRDKDHRVREGAVRALGKLGRAAVSALSQLQCNRDWKTRCYATRALARTGVLDATPGLLEALQAPDQPEGVLEEIAQGITRIGADAVSAVSALLQHQKANVRANATELLIRIATENPGPELLIALPALRRRLKARGEEPAICDRMTVAISIIDAVTQSTHDLPLAAAPPEVGPEVLPIPSENPRR